MMWRTGILITLAACQTTESPPPARTTPAPTSPTSIPAPVPEPKPTSKPTPKTKPCEPPFAPGELTAETREHDGVPRRYVISLPEDYDCTPRPLVIGLHGYYGSGRDFATSTANLLPELEADGWIGVFPNGLRASDEGYGRWVTSFNDLGSRQDDGPDGPTCTEDAYDYVAYDNCGPAEVDRACRWGTSCADDAGFLRALVTDLQDRLTIDPEHVVLTGFSQGGQTVQGLVCSLQDLVTVAANVHGFAANGTTCGPDAPVSLVSILGRTDGTVNGTEVPSDDGMIYDGSAETAAVWADAQDCATTPTPIDTAADGIQGWSCVAHAACASGAEVIDCAWDGGHLWGRSEADGNFTWDVIREVSHRRARQASLR